MASIQPAKGLSKKIGIVLAGPQKPTNDGRVSDIFLDAFAGAVKKEDRSLRLVTANDGPLPLFLVVMGELTSEPLNTPSLFNAARQAGYHGLMRVAVKDVLAFTKKTGILWFRKPRRFLGLNFIVDLYDPLTMAKIVGVVEEITIKISEAEYDMFVREQSIDFKELNDIVEDQSEDLAELVTETLEDLPWQISVIEVGADSLVLPAGLQAGLNATDRLAVIEGQRNLSGRRGQRFTLPGKRIAEVRITEISDRRAEARGENLDLVQVGDILVPLR
jgi:hypothetical protein